MPMNGKYYSLYIHVPFCQKKCPYCHFYVVAEEQRLKERYLQALKKEWELLSPKVADKELYSLYFGGGTPSCLSPDMIGEILSWFSFQAIEISLEANPENMTFSKVKAYKDQGINRMSIGIQSFNDTELNLLKRSHQKQKAIEAITLAKKAGIENLSIDLMYDLPSQTLSSWKKTLEVAVQLPITHLSLYNLTLEPKTPFYRQKASLKPLIPSQELSLQILETAIETLEKRGLKQYEISAFAQQGYRAQHNIGYWTGRPFWGLGPSAFSYWEGERIQNTANIHAYIQSLKEETLPIAFREKLPEKARIKECLAIGLRLLEGVSLHHFPSFPEETLKSLEKLSSLGLIVKDRKKVQLTPRGKFFYDTIAEELIDENA